MLLCSGSFHESWSLIRTTEVVRPRSIPNTQKYTSLSIYNICNQSTSISPSGATGSFPACQVILSSTRMNRWPAVTKAHSMGLPSSHHRPQIVRIKHTHTYMNDLYTTRISQSSFHDDAGPGPSFPLASPSLSSLAH